MRAKKSGDCNCNRGNSLAWSLAGLGVGLCVLFIIAFFPPFDGKSRKEEGSLDQRSLFFINSATNFV